MNDDKKADVHPIVKKALNLATVGEEPVEFSDEAIEELKRSIKQYFDKSDLLNAVVGLINLASILEEKGCQKASIRLMIVVATAAEPLEELKKKKINMGLDGAKASRKNSPD